MNKKIMAAILLMTALIFMPSKAKAGGGTSVCSLGVSTGTVVILCASAAGTLYDVEIDTVATAGDFITCYDSASASGFTAGIGGDCPAAALTGCQAIATVTGVTTNTSYHAEQGVIARKFVNGLVCLKRAATTSGRALYISP